MRQTKVWDIATRLFHWAIVVLIASAWATQHYDRMDLHVRVGYAILTLLLFRVVWGLIGSDTARFARLLRSPAAVFQHLAHLHRREPDHEAGHNAAGGWMVLVMLADIAVQAVTGLFSNDDGETEGPLMHLVSKDTSDWLSGIHVRNFIVIEVLIVLHIAAIIIYAVLKRQNLVWPMIHGTTQVPAGDPAPRMVSPYLALATLAAAIAAVISLVT
jgi:cytochrome b